MFKIVLEVGGVASLPGVFIQIEMIQSGEEKMVVP